VLEELHTVFFVLVHIITAVAVALVVEVWVLTEAETELAQVPEFKLVPLTAGAVGEVVVLVVALQEQGHPE
jgi:hypothetical protein